jgi:hypothetical protein
MKEKEITIVVNGTEHATQEQELTFEQLVEIAYGHPPEGGTIVYSITYERGQGNKPEGDLAPGETLKLKKEMLINVERTDRS